MIPSYFEKWHSTPRNHLKWHFVPWELILFVIPFVCHTVVLKNESEKKYIYIYIYIYIISLSLSLSLSPSSHSHLFLSHRLEQGHHGQELLSLSLSLPMLSLLLFSLLFVSLSPIGARPPWLRASLSLSISHTVTLSSLSRNQKGLDGPALLFATTNRPSSFISAWWSNLFSSATYSQFRKGYQVSHKVLWLGVDGVEKYFPFLIFEGFFN